MIINVVEDITTNFYLLNAVVVVGLIFYLLWRNSPSRRRHQLTGGPSKKGLKGLAQELEDMQNDPNDSSSSDEAPANETVVFNWNGHSWDAFEVLGIPTGSTRQQVDKAYSEEMAKMDEESQAFIEKAYQAILTQQGK